MAKFPAWGVGTDVNSTNLANGIPNIVNKAAVNNITSNTTLANDAELQNIALEVGTWEIEVKLLVSGAATAGDLKTQWSFTGTLTGTPIRDIVGPGAAGVSVVAPTALVNVNLSTLAYNSPTSYGIRQVAAPFYRITEDCTSFVVATAGNFAVQVAQVTSNATPTVINIGSRVKCRRIA